MTTSDRGSNEVASRNIIQAFISMHLGLAPVFYAGSDCCEHQGHLITLSSMKLIDMELQGIRSWRYFSSLAVFSHTLRGLAKKVYHEWCAQHGHLSAQESVYHLFPRCQAGRWNSTDATEKRILRCPQHEFVTVLAKVQAISEDDLGSADIHVWQTKVECSDVT